MKVTLRPEYCITLHLTAREAHILCEDFDRSREPSTTGKELLSVLFQIADDGSKKE